MHALAPPRGGGTATVILRLLTGNSELEVDTFTDWRARSRVRASDRLVPGRYRFFPKLPAAPAAAPGGEVLSAVLGTLNLLLAGLAGLRAGMVSRRRGSQLTLSVLDDGFSVLAGAIAARVAAVPHVIWVFDLWEENAYSRFSRRMASRLERGLLRRAGAILVHADEMSEHLGRKHGVRCEVLPTPVESGPAPEARPASDHETEILVSGALYWAQADAVLRLARVCERLDALRVTVLSKPELLKVRDLSAVEFEPGVPMEQVPARLAKADILFLGLSFGTAHPEIVKTATPARLPEYMASGVPILVHAPGGSHVTEYARREGFAWLVDEPDEGALERTLREILENPEEAAQRARRARELAAERHDADDVRARLIAVLGATSKPTDT